MKKILLLFFLSVFFTTQVFSQFTTDEITYVDRIDLENSNTWAIGGGVSNFIMHGDLRSIGTNIGNFYNFGGFAYIDKMFNPLLGLEAKVFYTEMSGGSQYLSDIYDILYVPDNIVRNGVSEQVLKENLLFRGESYGIELNLIFSFTNLYRQRASKWNAAGYFGAGYQQYKTALYEQLSDGSEFPFKDANFGFNSRRDNEENASSIYLSGQFGLKRRISKRFDVEVRTGMYFNYEDHLDATISNKQIWETYFVSSIGLSYKLGKRKIYTIWGDETDGDKRDRFKVKDADGDGVIDQLDIEPNTPKGVMVYGNGKAVDADNDGIPDHKDNCPLKYGLLVNKGCPTDKDTDGDGLIDSEDLCPTIVGPASNRGCPENKDETKDLISQQITMLAANIYFDTDKDIIKPISFSILDKIADLMTKIPDAKFMIEGHTDNTNTDRYNLYLSQKRVASVKRYLMKKGIDREKLSTIGYGESRPVYSNATAGGRQLNRRVEIKPVNDLNNNPTNDINIIDDNNNDVNKTSHIVNAGETLYFLSKKYKTSVEKLRTLNNLKDNNIMVGQKLKIK